MAKQKARNDMVRSTEDVTVVDGARVLGISYYIRYAKVCMEENNWYEAYMALGSALTVARIH